MSPSRRTQPKRARRTSPIQLGTIGEVARSLRPLDIAAIAVAVAIISAFVAVAAGRGEGAEVRVQSEEGTFLYSLAEDRRFELSGPLGTSTVEISSGQVRVVEDPGPLQICVRQGWIERPGEWLACLPSRIFIRIEGEQQGDVDAQTF